MNNKKIVVFITILLKSQKISYWIYSRKNAAAHQHSHLLSSAYSCTCTVVQCVLYLHALWRSESPVQASQTEISDSQEHAPLFHGEPLSTCMGTPAMIQSNTFLMMSTGRQQETLTTFSKCARTYSQDDAQTVEITQTPWAERMDEHHGQNSLARQNEQQQQKQEQGTGLGLVLVFSCNVWWVHSLNNRSWLYPTYYMYPPIIWIRSSAM